MPTFSIIVPTYNQQDYLREALDSLLNQSEEDWEAVVVNDGSTDDTADTIYSYSQRDSRIIGINKINGGTASALNTGLRHVKGNWICWLSSDDIFEKNKLELHRQYFDIHPDAQFFFSDFSLFDDQGHVRNGNLTGIGLEIQQEHLINLLGRSYINGISICVNSTLWKQTGFFREHLRYAQDYDMWLRLLAAGNSFFIPERTCLSRTHPQQGSNIFNEACVYDSGKAAIDFFNYHSFQHFFPLTNLHNKHNAKKALLKSLQIAALPNSLCYGIGIHPCLVNRIVEWISNPSLSSNTKRDLINIVRMRTDEIMGSKESHAFKLIWWNAMNAMQSNTSPTYFLVSPIQTAQASYARNARNPSFNSLALKRYASEFDNKNLPEASVYPDKHKGIIVLVWRKLYAGNFDASFVAPLNTTIEYLQKTGFEVVTASDDENFLAQLQFPFFVKLDQYNDINKIMNKWSARLIELHRETLRPTGQLQDTLSTFFLSVRTLRNHSTQEQLDKWLHAIQKTDVDKSLATIRQRTSSLIYRLLRIVIQFFFNKKYSEE